MNFRLLLIIPALILLINTTVHAQPKMHERMIDAQCKEVVKELNLDDKKVEADFISLYKKYLIDLDVNKKAYIKVFRISADTLNNEQIDAYLLKNFYIDKQNINIKEKYYKEFKNILEPRQILKVYQTEAEILKRITMEFCKRNDESSNKSKE